jgi:rhomboid protease GluP
MCPNCRAFITITDRVCPYCDANVGPRAVDMRGSAFAASFLPRANLSSIIVLAINFALFLVELAVAHSLTVPAAGVGDASRLAVFGYHQWWRLITAGFFHGGWLHLLMNSWSLFILVTEVEQFYGTNRLIVTYVFATITGFLCACFFSPNPVLGASCAAFGLMGVMLAMGIGQRADPLTQAVRRHYGQWLVFGLAMSLGGGISMSGHIGGLIGGFLVGIVAGRPGHPAAPRETFWKIVAGVCLGAVLLSFYYDFSFVSLALRSS